MKDSIDFGSMDVSMLFRKLLVPTVLGMVFSIKRRESMAATIAL